MAGDTPKEDEPTEEKPKEEKPKEDEAAKAVEPPDIFLAAAGGGLVGGAVGAAIVNYLMNS